MRFLIAVLFLCLTVPAKAERVDQFVGDRYRIAYGGGYARDVAVAVKKQRAKAKRKQQNYRPPGYPVVKRKPVYAPPQLTIAQGAGREFDRAITTFVRGRLVCAVNVGRALAARGIKGTGSALAKSYLAWGRASGPTPGAVAVFSRGRRGGHVAIVHSVLSNGIVIYLNPSSRRQAWVIGPYRKRPIGYRVAV